jgi:hypothetical protein
MSGGMAVLLSCRSRPFVVEIENRFKRGGLLTMKIMKNLLMSVLIALCALAFGSCRKSEDDKGPMEKAGKAIDETMEKAGEQAGRAMERAGEAMKEAGEKMRESSEKARRQ